MLEILFLVFLCRSVGNILKEKKRSPILFYVLMVVFWFGGEVCGAVAYGVFLAINGGEFDFLGYIAALVGAVVGAGLVFLMANLVPAAPSEPSYGTTYGPGTMGYPGQPTSQNPYNPYGEQKNPYDKKW